jgi:uncharacterized protein (UPF0332 family)
LALHHDLLEQAEHLVRRERLKPKQASLRRSVSTAYYALFHLLIDYAISLMASRKPPGLRVLVGRAFAHGEMHKVCKNFASGGLPDSTKSLLAAPLSPHVRMVAAVFFDLQDARHEADYNVAKSWTRLEATRHIQKVDEAFKAAEKIWKTPEGNVFFAALLLQRQWTK